MGSGVDVAYPPAVGQIPIGGVVAVFWSAGDPVPDPAYWEECDGHVCVNAASTKFGKVIEDINGQITGVGLFLRGTPIPHGSVVAGSATHTHGVIAGAAIETGTITPLDIVAADNLPPYITTRWWMRVL